MAANGSVPVVSKKPVWRMSDVHCSPSSPGVNEPSKMPVDKSGPIVKNKDGSAIGPVAFASGSTVSKNCNGSGRAVDGPACGCGWGWG